MARVQDDGCWQSLRSATSSDEAFHSDLTPEELYGHELLLADTVRMNAYRDGIRRNVKPGDVVVDLGTGTGILAMLAAQQRAKVVHAIELSDMIARG